ncbi:MAG: hypothetical protein AAGI30_08500 [Planctomycetota bacterium]
MLKFGSSILTDVSAFDAAAREVASALERRNGVVAVVSAVGDTTDELIAQAATVRGGTPDPAALATLLSTGEIASAALLACALHRIGVEARALDVHQLGLRGSGSIEDALPKTLDVGRLRGAIDEHRAVIVPGFIVVGPDGELLLTGRGGSDLSALFLASQLDADVRLVKDVAGVFESDPNVPGPPPRRYATLSWAEAAEVGGVIVQPKACHAAAQWELAFEVASLGAVEGDGTRIGPFERTFAAAPDGVAV